MTPLRLRTRLTLWYSLALAVVLVVFAVAITWQQGRIGLRRIDRELDGVTATLAGLLEDELSENDKPPQAAREVQQTIAVTGRHVAIATADGTPLTTDPLANTLTATVGQTAPSTDHWSATSADAQWRVGGRRARLHGETYILLAAAPLADATRERREAAEAMWTGIPLLLVLAAAGGLWIASAGLRPVTRMAERAAHLPVEGTQDLGQSGRDDEVGRLEGAFNDLLVRLRQALVAQRQFMADASHELRTPLGVVRSVADVTLDREHRDEGEYRDALATVGAQSRRASRLVDDMLMLARADAGGYPLHHVPLYLDELVAECRQSLTSLACERGISLDVTGDRDIPFVGDEELLRRMVLNVLQNAVQHTPRGGRVCVAVTRDANVSVVVRDQGPGIADPDRARIFDRFVQLDPARRQAGAGLGLPIARWIAEAHGGRLELRESSAAGSTFAAVLPLTAAPDST